MGRLPTGGNGGDLLNEAESILIAKAKRGDSEAFEELVKSYYKTVFNIALKMFANREDASDMAQEAFIKIYKSIGSFKGESSFKTWLYRVATNLCLDELRSRKKRKIISFDEQFANTDSENIHVPQNTVISPESELLKKELRDCVNDAIKKLPDDLRLAVILRDIQNFSYHEISAILTCAEGTVKSRISRGREQLRKLLSEKEELFGMNFVKSSRKEPEIEKL